MVLTTRMSSGGMIYTTMSPEKNYGYEMVEQNEELKHILDSSSQIESAS
ncbi:MAG: hypothetical protein ACLUO9_02460 [Coprococcus comes]